jgi:hypothetical protein
MYRIDVANVAREDEFHEALMLIPSLIKLLERGYGHLRFDVVSLLERLGKHGE